MIISKVEKEKKIEKNTLNYFLSFRDKSKEDGESIGKSHKTNPVKVIEDIRISHNRTKSDIQPKNASLLERFLTHVKRKNSFKNSFKEEEQLGKCFEVIEEEKEDKAPVEKKSKSKSKKLHTDSWKQQNDQNVDTKNMEKQEDNFQQTRKTDTDYNLQSSVVLLNDSIEEIARLHVKDFEKVKKHEWKVLTPQRDLRLGLLNNKFSKISLIKTVNAHLDGIHQLGFANSSTLFSAGEDSVVKEWRLEREGDKSYLEPISTFRYHRAPILSTAVSEYQHISGDSTGKMMLLEQSKDSWQYSRLFNTGNEPIWSLDLCQKNGLIVSTTPNKVKFWATDQLSDKKPQCALSSTKTFYTEAQWIDGGQCVIQTCDSAYKNSAFLIYDVQKESESLKIKQELTVANRFKLLRRDHMLVTANDNHTISLYDTRDYKPIKTFVAHSNPITALDISENSHMLITGDLEGSMRLWDLQTFRCIQELSVHRKKYDESILDIKIDPESRIVATAGADSTIRLFSLN